MLFQNKSIRNVVFCLIALGTFSCGYNHTYSQDPQYANGLGETAIVNDEFLEVEYGDAQLAQEEQHELFSDEEIHLLTFNEEPLVPLMTSAVKKKTPKNTGNKQAVASSSNVKVVISLARQKMSVYVQGILKHSWPVSTGSTQRYGKGAATPRGSWKPFLMDARYRSRQFNVILPFGIKFVGGILIHASNGPMGKPMSHGCVRLSPSNARTLFQLVKSNGMKNTLITVQ
ncbi:MAG: L,D-transpeptidase [Bdellovibrionaceae bacterium]|nr:L,D-transpeptidase [Pseudobdellovibrionaceae bacterium]